MENIDEIIRILNESLQTLLNNNNNKELEIKTKSLYDKLYQQLKLDFENDDFMDFYSLDHYDKIINLIVDNSDNLKDILNLNDENRAFLQKVINLINTKKRERYELDLNDEYASRGFGK